LNFFVFVKCKHCSQLSLNLFGHFPGYEFFSNYLLDARLGCGRIGICGNERNQQLSYPPAWVLPVTCWKEDWTCPGIKLPLTWAIVLWVISGILIIFAGIVAFGSCIWPFLKTIRVVRQRQAPSWLEQILICDKSQLNARIYGRNYDWHFDRLMDVEPYVELGITIINAAIFSILVTRVEGRFVIESGECPYAAESTWGQVRIPHGESTSLRLRQHLTKDMAQMILRLRDETRKLRVDIGSCRLIVEPEIPGEQTKPVQMGISNVDEYKVDINF